MSEKTYNVLFLCTGNSARSIMAEAILNREGGAKFKAFSAGSQPKGHIDPTVLNLLKKLNFPTDSFRSKSWEEFARPGAPELDFVFTVCDNAAGEVCPIWPGQPFTSHWGIPDPAAATGTEAQIAGAFLEAHRVLGNRISLLTNLPVDKLDGLSLQRRLDAIGKNTEQPEPAH